MKKKLSFAVTVVTAAVLATSTTIPEVTHGHDQAHDPDLWKVLQPLETVVSFMNTGAHPDDERSALLSYMSLGNGVRTSSVIANRGEGGQNEIGTELGNGLGIIRSLELEEASEVLNLDLRILSEQLDDDIYDFGFSKSIDETLDEWGEERVYERLIRTIREERPDILFTSFLDVPSQHGHHRTMTVLTERAFVDAADASVFPEHADEGLLPWQPLKFYLPGTEETETLNFNIGIYDPIYEKTYPQLGEESRFLHRSQGMGRDLPIEDFFQSLNLAGSQVSEEDEEDIFTGLAFDLREYGKTLDNRSWENRLARLQTSLDEVVATYPDREGVYVEAVQSLREVRSAQHIADRQNMDTDLLERLDVKEAQLQRVVDESGEVEVTVTSSAYEVTRDGQVEVTIDIDNENPRPLVQLNADLHLPEGWQVTDQDVPRNVKANQKAKATFTVAIGEDAEFFDAYGEPAIIGDLSYRLRGNVVEHQVSTEETVAVLPKVGLELSPEATILNTQTRNDEIELEVTATNYYEGGYETSIRLEPTAGLTVEQATKNVQFKEVGEKKTLTFTVTGHESLTDAQESVRIYAGDDSTIVQPIDYDHIEQSYWLKDGQLDVEAFSLEVDETLRIGYIESGFDTVSERLKEAGLNVESIDEAMLTSGDLSEYDTIVVGIRAYLSRNDLLANNDRLLQYVENGGHVVMQYHNPNDNWDPQLAPYSVQPGSPSIEWRVTDQTAHIDVLEPNHPVFSEPNQIGSSDFDGWVQERGLYYPSSWDERFTPLMSMADPEEEALDGGLLVAEFGDGTYAYTSLSWYRQLQAQVPGGYRLFVNLLSYPHAE